ncbi:MAG: FAD-dependent oxidoreductase [Myxococcota bacterium]
MPSRRTVLKLGAAALTLAGIGLLGAGVAIQPRRVLRAPARPDDARLPERVGAPKRVVVVGGGLAGIAAATALAERGYTVTLFEAASQLGGKLGGWEIEALGERFPVEHGFHGFFAQYYNLRDLLGAAGALDDLAPSAGYPVRFPDRPAERFGTTTSVFPANLLSVITQSEALRFEDFAGDRPGLLDLMRFDPERTFAALDGVDFLTFARDRNVPRSMVDTVLRPFADTTLNRAERLSAAEALRFFHFYFLGNPERRGGRGRGGRARRSRAGAPRGGAHLRDRRGPGAGSRGRRRAACPRGVGCHPRASTRTGAARPARCPPRGRPLRTRGARGCARRGRRSSRGGSPGRGSRCRRCIGPGPPPLRTPRPPRP